MATKKAATAPANGHPGIPVLVTTEHRGVFFGYAPLGYKAGDDPIALKGGRNCIYWSTDTKGFLGLAAKGPTSGCRIGPAADIELRKITSVTRLTDEAVKAWESAPWSR